MLDEAKVTTELRFIETCLQLQLLDATDARSLSDEIKEQGGFASQCAVRRGLLTPADVDIVQSLQNPLSIVPGYEILDLIGRGAMGVVYRAKQLDLEKIVALKTILISNVHDPVTAARFEREAKSLAKLQHPNVVQALNFGKHQGRYYLAMEYVHGLTCEQAVHSGRCISPARTWCIVRQIAAGLMHAFGQNLIHRDIKPANIILLPPPSGAVSQVEIAKIADFGLAMFADQSPEDLKLTTGDKIMGSPAYMSLEQFGGRAVDFRSDMYSLGATAWHLLFGMPPFQGRTVAALFQQKSEPFRVDPSELPTILPDDQMCLLFGLLDPDPDRRPQSYEQLIEAIDALGICNSDGLENTATELQRPEFGQFSVSELPTLETAFVSSDSNEQNSQGQTTEPVNEMAETLEVSPFSIRRFMQRQIQRPKRLAGIGLFAILVSVIGIAFSLPPSRGARSHTRVVGSVPLFDGVTLSGWDVGGSMVGAWNTVEAPDSSTAIACVSQQGALTRRIPDTPYLRISLFVWLQQDGGFVDIDFAMDPAESSDIRGCLRLSGDRTQLGEKSLDFDEIDVESETEAPPTIHERYNTVHLERQPTDWYVFVEEKLVGTLPIDRVGRGNGIRLVVHQGTTDTKGSQAFFADVQLYDLRD